MAHSSCLIALSVGSLLWSLLAAAESAKTSPSPDQFTQLAPITVAGDNPIAVTARLPPWVFLSSQQQLADLRVFNAAGIAVAHQLNPLIQTRSSPAIELPTLAVPALTPLDPFNNAATVQLDTQGKLSIQLRPDRITPPNPRIIAWIIDDHRPQPAAVNSFDIELQASAQQAFEATVSIEQSADLRTWQTLVSNQKLLSLSNHQQNLSQRHISIASSSARYWRIRAEAGDLSGIAHIWVNLPAVESVLSDSQTRPCQLSADNRQVLCSLGAGAIPISTAQFDFGQQAIAFNAELRCYANNPEAVSKQPVLPSQQLSTTFTRQQTQRILP